jgi:putative methyltransferase (TIGR04325 family)
MFTELLMRLTKKTNLEYFSSWQTAKNQCIGYDSENLVKAFEEAATAVERGDAVFDQDGKAYRHFHDNEHLVAALTHVSENKGHFQVLDFGGALGNVYRQHRWFLSSFKDFIWCVVDQERFVETGKRLFTNRKLKFENTIPEAVSLYKPNIAVISNTLQRMERPFEVLNQLAELDIPYLFIDRTPVISCAENRITCGTYPSKKNTATFPAWHFSEVAFKQALQEKYRIIKEFNADSKTSNTRQIGFFCEKI